MELIRVLGAVLTACFVVAACGVLIIGALALFETLGWSSISVFIFIGFLSVLIYRHDS